MKAIILSSLIGLAFLIWLISYSQQPIVSVDSLDEDTVPSSLAAEQSTPSHFSDRLTFSNTQQWNEDLRGLIFSLATTSRLNLLTQIKLSPPPRNSSDSTQQELELLHQYVSERNSEVVAAIYAEDTFTPKLAFGPRTLGDFLFTTERVHTRKLFDELFRTFAPIVMSLKDSFDRVRPSYLDPTLTTVIAVPEHPAYPSGHASQAFVMAEFMSALDPEHTQAYFSSATAIARHREVAGLHYPSDTEAGRLLAKQFFEVAMNDPSLLQLFRAAKSEWSAREGLD